MSLKHVFFHEDSGYDNYFEIRFWTAGIVFEIIQVWR